MMVYNGYDDFVAKMASIKALPLQARLLEEKKAEAAPITVRPAMASTPYTNTPARASSTFVREIKKLPGNICIVRLANRNYSYMLPKNQLFQWLQSNSLGKYYNQHVKLR